METTQKNVHTNILILNSIHEIVYKEYGKE